MLGTDIIERCDLTGSQVIEPTPDSDERVLIGEDLGGLFQGFVLIDRDKDRGRSTVPRDRDMLTTVSDLVEQISEVGSELPDGHGLRHVGECTSLCTHRQLCVLTFTAATLHHTGVVPRSKWRLPCCSSCCTLSGMDTLSRKTINFDHTDTPVVGPFLDEDSAEHAALERLVGERLASDSAELRALVMLGVRRVQEALLEDAYNQAVDAGDFDDTTAWVEQTSRARRRRRTPA